MTLGCYDCGLEYGGPAWADFVIPDAEWLKISPTGHDGGLLCASCMIRRAREAGIECEGKFTSGPFRDDNWRKPR